MTNESLTIPLPRLCVAVLVLALVSGCAASRAARRGEIHARAGDWDAAVAYYTRAVQADPDKPEYKIALERAMIAASRLHYDRARELEQKDQLDAAIVEYRRAAEFDPANRQAASKATELERTIRDRIEAARPKPPIEKLREQARRATAEPLLNPASREPLEVKFNNASLRDILNAVAQLTGINITYDRDFQERSYSVELHGVTLEEALNQILTANQHFYKVLNERTIIVVPDSPQKRAQYEEQVIRTFFISHADVQELSQLVSTIIRLPTMAVQPMVAINKANNSLTVRSTAAVAAIIERIIAANDKPRAEVVVDVEILEVNRSRAKSFGLNLTQYAVGGIFSPEVAPPNEPTSPDAVGPPPPFNLNTVSQGISTADFYGAVPAAFVRFLESDSQTKLIAKPQLRGAEGQKLTLNLGDRIPVPSTVFGTQGVGGVATIPISSFNYENVGVNVEMTPRVTFEGEIVMDLLVESSTLGESISVAGQALPTFGSRKVTTRIRLREGESNLLAGLLREDTRKSLTGFPGLLRVPILKQLFAANEEAVSQTDIVMLITPRIVRTQEITQQDVSPIFIGTQQSPGITGPPPIFGQPPEAAPPPAPGVPPPPPGAPGAPVPPETPTPATPPGTLAPPTGTGPRPTAPGTAPAPGAIITPSPAPPPGPTTPPAIKEPTVPAPAPPAAPAAQILVTPPGTEFRVGGGPYTVPISISGATQLSIMSLTLTFNPAVLRVRAVQEGSFMRQGGVAVNFVQQADATTGRLDITITRTGDTTGASGAGLVAAVLFDATGPGTSPITSGGIATTATGSPLPVQFTPVTVTVK